MEIRTVTVIGANGTMGKNVSAIFASFGGAKVYMICRELEAAKKAIQSAKMSVKAEAIEANLIAKTYDDLRDCISESDLIFESVFEDIHIKKDVYEKISKYISPSTIIGTGTSGLSINELSSFFKESFRPNFMGIHMFNPPYNMPLCEVIPSRYTDQKLLGEVKNYLKDTLLRSVVEVKDEPAFMGNRIGFQFINEALQYAEKYATNGGIDYIDSIIGPFTGRSMSPLVTADFVGLDVHKAIVDNVYNNSNDFAHDTFEVPAFVLNLISEGHLGRKSGCGLYQTIVHSDGTKTVLVFDVETGQYRPRKKYSFSFANNMINELKIGNYQEAFKCLTSDNSVEAKICLEFLLKYVVYSIATTKAVGESIHSSDDVMATGFNWIPPLAIVDVFGGANKFMQVAKNNLDSEYLSKVDIEDILQNIPQSNYDFRPFFKARG